jgi:hypothetical protein
MPLMIALTLSAVTSVTLPPQPARPICPASRIERADARLRPHISRLGDMPPAKHLLAVLHTENGCEKPLVVHAEVGAKSR